MSTWKVFAVCWIVCLLAARLEAGENDEFREDDIESNIVYDPGTKSWNATDVVESIVPAEYRNYTLGPNFEYLPGVYLPEAVYVSTEESGIASGTFRDGSLIDIGFNRGVLMTSGRAWEAEGPNMSPVTIFEHSAGLTQHDQELEDLAPFDPQSNEQYDVTDYDTLVLPITWDKPVHVHTDYVFASEEYSEFVGSIYYDIMAVFVEQDGVQGHDPMENAAVIPGLTAADGAISVNGINGGVVVPHAYSDAEPPVEPSRPEYYNDNSYTGDQYTPADFEYDGFTDVLTATAFGVDAGSYDLKFGVGDVGNLGGIGGDGDQMLDCAIFIAEGSLWLEPLLNTQGAGGSWGSGSTWDGVIHGYPAGTTPDTDRAAVIGSHTVTTAANATASSVRIDDSGAANGQLIVGAGTQLTVGTDVWVAGGTLQVNGTLTANSNLPHGAGSELIIYSGSTVLVASGATVEVTDVDADPAYATRDNRVLVAGGSLQVDGTLTTGTLLLQEADSQAVLTSSSTANVHRHVRVNSGTLTIDGALNIGEGIVEGEQTYGRAYAVMVQGEDAQLSFGPAASEQLLPSLEVAKGTFETNRQLTIDDSVGIGANPLYVMRDDPATQPPVDESKLPVATVRIGGEGKLVVNRGWVDGQWVDDVWVEAHWGDGDLVLGQKGGYWAPMYDEVSLYDANVHFEVDLISPPEDGSDPSLGVRIEATGDIDLKSTKSGLDQQTLRFRPNHLHPFTAGTIDFMVAGGSISGDFAHATTGDIDVGLGTTGVYTQGWPVQISGGTATVTVERNLCIGDADFSGSTDLSDFNIWNANKFTTGTDWSTGDFNGDGLTDLSDFNIWNQYKFTATQPPAGPMSMGGMMSPLSGEVLDIFYDPTSGELTVDTNGLNFQTLLIPGLEAISNDRWLDGTWEDNTIWVQQYFGGKEQWWGQMHIPGPLPDGQYQIATYEPGLTADDFGPVEYMVIEDILYVDVQILGGAQPPPPMPVPEPGVVGMLLAAMATAGLFWRRRSMVR